MDNLPRYFVLESLSDKKYLRYVHEEGVPLQGHVEFSGEEAISPYTKYELEPATKEANKGLFNIRCCYNNKYWTRKEESTGWITATADEPEEDPFEWRCTLFEASFFPGPNKSKRLKLIMRYVQLLISSNVNTDVSIGDGGGDPKYRLCLNADANAPALVPGDYRNTMFSIIDFDSFVILPKRVLFKGDNGLYVYDNTSNLVVVDSSEVSSVSIQHEVLYAGDGSARIRRVDSYFWRTTNEHTLARHGADNDAYSLYSVHKARGKDEVALRNKGTGRFCQRQTAIVNRLNWLLPTAYYMVKETILRVEEPVSSRSIYNVDFRLNDARIYNRRAALMANKRFSNHLDVEKVFNVSETFTKETSRTWKSIVSLILSTPTTIETEIPLILDGVIDLLDSFKGPYEWGTDVKGSQIMEVSDEITIPAKSVAIVYVTATRATCDVPFSYMQQDRFFNGEVVSNKMDDGVYTGINYYNFSTQVVTQKL